VRPSRYVTGFVNAPHRCVQGHRHGSPETALACDCQRWIARMIDTLQIEPQDAARRVKTWQETELRKIERGREIARNRQ